MKSIKKAVTIQVVLVIFTVLVGSTGLAQAAPPDGKFRKAIMGIGK